MNTVAGIRNISLQAMNLRMFCWLAVSLSRKFLTKARLLGPMAYKDVRKKLGFKKLGADPYQSLSCVWTV